MSWREQRALYGLDVRYGWNIEDAVRRTRWASETETAPTQWAGRGLGRNRGALQGRVVVCLAILLSACGGEQPSPTPEEELPAASEDFNRDIETTFLEVALETLTATATVQVVASDSSTGLSFEAQGLTVTSVTREDGTPLQWEQAGETRQLNVGLPLGETTLKIAYGFEQRGFSFDGYMTEGDTFIWPNFCGNLFPCHSDPADGLRFGVEVTGVPEGYTVVAPQTLLDLPAPSYQLAFNVGKFTRHDLGTTEQGTRVVFFSQPTDDPEDIASGAGNLKAYVETLEGFFGPYPFGEETGAKSVLWCEEGGCAYAGMEEHPYFDVSDGSVNDPSVFSHEASHAYFGDGIRLECWGEDLILSEGTASYLEIVLLHLVDGPEAAQADVTYYQDWLAESIDAGEDAVVWPDGCDQIDTYSIWYGVTYSRGALFWMDVQAEVGMLPLVEALATFSARHLGKMGTMQTLLDTVATETGFDPNPLAKIWLKSTTVPEDYLPTLAASRERNRRTPFQPRPEPHRRN